jgi:hypothetical protein
MDKAYGQENGSSYLCHIHRMQLAANLAYFCSSLKSGAASIKKTSLILAID